MPGKLITLITRPAVPLTVIGVCAAAFATASFAGGTGHQNPAPGKTTSEVTLVSGLEATESATLADWTGVADHVVRASVVSERKLTAPQSETSDPADELVGREVTLTVSEVLWSDPAAHRKAPSTATMPVFGWQRSGGGALREMAPAGGARLEVGHEYVVALVHTRAECSEGDRNPARWSVIGSGGAIPVDGGVLGRGEFEGTSSSTRTPADLGAVGSVARGFASRDLGTLRSALAAADARTAGPFESGSTRGCSTR